MEDDGVRVEKRGAAGIVTINRPEAHNALTRKMMLAIDGALTSFETDEDIRSIIFTGAGDKAFIAGGDIADLESRRGIAHYKDMGEIVHRLYRRIETSDKVTIGAINGLALGGGAELILCLDIRILAENVRIGLPEINLGMFPGAGGTQRLLRQVPLCRAKELMLTGEWISAQEAVSLGLANRVVPAGAALSEALAFAHKLATKPPLATTLLKRSLLHGAEMPLGSALAYELSMNALVFESEDMHEGCRAFLAKRPPLFKGY